MPVARACTHQRLSPFFFWQIIPDISVIGVRSKTQITAKVLQAAKNLMAIGCFCIGTDQTDLAQVIFFFYLFGSVRGLL